MDQPTFNSILLAVLSAIMAGLFAVWFRSSGRREVQLDEIIDRLDAIEKQNVGFDVKIIPLWAKAQKELSESLHHPHAKDREADDLLDKLEMTPEDMEEEETDRLKNLLLMRSIDASVSFEERRAATIMPLIMDIVLERGEGTEGVTIVPVAVDPPKNGEPPEEKE